MLLKRVRRIWSKKYYHQFINENLLLDVCIDGNGDKRIKGDYYMCKSKKFKVVRWGLICVSTILVISFCVLSILHGDFLWFIKKNEVPVPIEKMYKDNQQIVIDDYTIKQTYSYYDRDNNEAYCVYEVTYKGEYIENNMVNSLGVPQIGEKFGENLRFSLHPYADNAVNYEFEYVVEDEIIYIYITFKDKLRNADELRVYLYDRMAQEDEIKYNNEYVNFFSIKESKEYSNNGM